jgi:hypothetical protein
MPFRPGEIRVFDKAGYGLGVLRRFSVTAPRTYRLNDIEDFGFAIPRNVGPVPIITSADNPSYVGTTSAKSGTGTLSLTLPAGTDVGALLLAAVSVDSKGMGGQFVDAPAGWDVVEATPIGGDHSLQVFQHKLLEGETGPWSFRALDDSAAVFATDMVGAVMAYGGAYAAAPASGHRVNDTTTPEGPRIVVPYQRERVVTIIATPVNDSSLPPAGYDLIASDFRTFASLAVAHRIVPKRGLLQAYQWTRGSVGDSIVMSIAIQQTPSVEAMLVRDNLVLVQNMLRMRPWAGAIDTVEYGDEAVAVRCVGGLSLFKALETELIEQTGGDAAGVARRLVRSAQAKQGAHGDLVVGFVADGAKPVYGKISVEGDILAGLQQVARDTLSELWIDSSIQPNGRLKMDLHWNGTIEVDHRSIVIRDGPGGNLVPGARVSFSGADRVNYARLVGAPTQMAQYLDYQSAAAVIEDITPWTAVSLSETELPGARRREAMNFSVPWGLSEDAQKALAKQIQEVYLDFYRSFLFAYHERWGAPFLEGYDWSGPTPEDAKRFVDGSWRTINQLAYIGHRTVITNVNPNTGTSARIDDWKLRVQIGLGNVVGIATDFGTHFDKLVADFDGWVASLKSRTIEDPDAVIAIGRRFSVTQPGESLRGIATDAAEPSSVWVLVVEAGRITVRKHDRDSLDPLVQWSRNDMPMANDLAVDAKRGLLFIGGNDGVGNVSVLDINSGVVLRAFPSGFDGISGISVAGGIVYVAHSNGDIRMLFEEDGMFAGHFETGLAGTVGLYVSPEDAQVWVPVRGGVTGVYHAAISVAVADGPGPVTNSPGFPEISAGQYLHLVMADNRDFGAALPNGDPVSSTAYRPLFRSQVGWGTRFDNDNCGAANGAMALDRQTLGRLQKTPPQIRAAQGDQIGGIDLYDVQRAWLSFGEDPVVESNVPWGRVLELVRAGRGVIVTGNSNEAWYRGHYRCGSVGGPHSIFLNEINSDGSFRVYDPACSLPTGGGGRRPGVKWIPARYVKQYCEAFSGRTGRVESLLATKVIGGGGGEPVPTERKVFAVYSKGHWVDVVVPSADPTEVGQVQKEWKIEDDQISGYIGGGGTVPRDLGPGVFKPPFECGATYWGSTYVGHSANSVDFNQPNFADTGDPVLASADGTVILRDNAYGRIDVAHVGGYKTTYAHMADIRVNVNDAVKLGDQVGVISAVAPPESGITGAHLHYNQWLGSSTIPIRFDGVLLGVSVGHQRSVAGWCPAPVTQPADGSNVLNLGAIRLSGAQVVIQGEEGRVDQWDPVSMGYGVKGWSYYGTMGTAYFTPDAWYLKPWDVAPAVFQPAEPDWPEGAAYLADMLVRFNREQGAQALEVVNRNGLWEKIVLGGIYAYQQGLQGPYPDGISGFIRVVSFSPDEYAGTMQLLAEWVDDSATVIGRSPEDPEEVLVPGAGEIA